MREEEECVMDEGRKRWKEGRTRGGRERGVKEQEERREKREGKEGERMREGRSRE